MKDDSHLPDEDKIRVTVETCLAFAAEAERPFQQGADLLAMLKNTPGWTDAEIFEVQGQIMEGLARIAKERIAARSTNNNSS
jgi:hypothetical protein